MTLPPVSPGDAFAFYGLLKQGADGMPAHINLEAAGRFEGPAFIRANVFDLGGYPGVVPGDGLCRAMLWRVRDPAVIPDLDAFEDLDPADPDRSLYWRKLTPLLTATGQSVGETAQVYWYNRPITGQPRIEDGNWPLHRPSRWKTA
ncbi:MAG: gamma-glutamylcyclotransferase family protein [Pseudomonadota bacterium]